MSQTDGSECGFYARRKTEPQAELQAEEVLPSLLLTSRAAVISVAFYAEVVSKLTGNYLFINLFIYKKEIRGNSTNIFRR